MGRGGVVTAGMQTFRAAKTVGSGGASSRQQGCRKVYAGTEVQSCAKQPSEFPTLKARLHTVFEQAEHMDLIGH